MNDHQELPYPQVKYQSEIDLGSGKKLRCYVLEDGTRLLDADDLHKFFGVKDMNELISLMPEPQRTEFLKKHGK